MGDFPVHSSITVTDANTIYRTEDWWKAAVTHSIDGHDNGIAIYLWHHDDDWSRKNKYHVKTSEAWQSDRQLIQQYLDADGVPVKDQDDFPVSDYYHLSQGETVFKTDDWWKAIVAVDEKGSYETHEVIIYLWQRVDGDWRRRQKYAIKNTDDWTDDRDAVDELVDLEESSEESEIHSATRAEQEISATGGSDPATEGDLLSEIQSEFKELHVGDSAT